MNFDIRATLDSAKEGIKEVAEVAQEKTKAFHENYISDILPDCGKYGDEAKFVAEMVPGVAEYNAIKDGDWTAFAIAAGIDVAAIAVAAVTAGAGYAATKGGAAAAKAGVKVATKEIAEAAAETVVKETVEAAAETVVKETIEATAETVVKETVEATAETVVKETIEAGAETAVKETIETGVETAVRETAEVSAEKLAKESVETGVEQLAKASVESGAEKTVKETVESGTEKAIKEVAETSGEKMIKETAESGVEQVSKETVEAGAETVAKESAEGSAEIITKEISDEGAQTTDNLVHRYMECRNQGLEGAQHPMTGVEFARKTVDNGAGEIVEGVFPKFDSVFDTKLPDELYQESNFRQFKQANKDLLEKIDSTPELKKQFSSEQIEQIREGITTGAAPDGFVWHHNEEAGVLQLVDELIHSKTGHTGGREIWGGGY